MEYDVSEVSRGEMERKEKSKGPSRPTSKEKPLPLASSNGSSRRTKRVHWSFSSRRYGDVWWLNDGGRRAEGSANRKKSKTIYI